MVLYHIKEHLECGLSEEALAYVDDRLEHLFLQTVGYWSAYEQWLSELEAAQYSRFRGARKNSIPSKHFGAREK